VADILDKILAVKARRSQRRRRPGARPPCVAKRKQRENRGIFIGALARKNRRRPAAVIAEIKKASPSKGVLRERFDPAAIARFLRAARRGVPLGAHRRAFFFKVAPRTFPLRARLAVSRRCARIS